VESERFGGRGRGRQESDGKILVSGKNFSIETQHNQDENDPPRRDYIFQGFFFNL
jgi:hypothetical protein